MPFMSDKELDKLAGKFRSMQSTVSRWREKVQSPVARAFRVAEFVGGAAGAAYVRGQVVGRGNAYQVMGMDPEMIAGSAMILAGFFGVTGKYDDDIINVGSGILSVWTTSTILKFATEKAQGGKWLGSGYSAPYGYVGATGPGDYNPLSPRGVNLSQSEVARHLMG